MRAPRSRPSRDASDHGAYRLIVQAASNRAPCPANDALAAAMGARVADAGGWALERLAKRGMISIAIIGGERVVTVTEFGTRTKVPDGWCGVCGAGGCDHSALTDSALRIARRGEDA